MVTPTRSEVRTTDRGVKPRCLPAGASSLEVCEESRLATIGPPVRHRPPDVGRLRRAPHVGGPAASAHVRRPVAARGRHVGRAPGTMVRVNVARNGRGDGPGARGSVVVAVGAVVQPAAVVVDSGRRRMVHDVGRVNDLGRGHRDRRRNRGDGATGRAESHDAEQEGQLVHGTSRSGLHGSLPSSGGRAVARL